MKKVINTNTRIKYTRTGRKVLFTVKKAITIFLLVIMLLQGNVQLLGSIVFAAASSPSAEEIATEMTLESLESTASARNITGEVFSESLDDNSQKSAVLKLRTHVKELFKKVFQSDESIKIAIQNVYDDKFRVKLLDHSGKEEKIYIEEEHISNQIIASIDPESGVKPGEYTLVVENEEGKEISRQDFSWGVLALNTNKSVYSVGETANIAIAVLDSAGMMVCDAKVELSIKNPELSIEDELSTEDGTITVNPECSLKDFTLEPDYEAEYELEEEGVYEMTLSATTKSGTYTITDDIQVKNDVPFEIERTSATRIYPIHEYPVEITVTANHDFSGTFTERVPSVFQVRPASESAEFKVVDSGEISQSSIGEVLGASTTRLRKPFDGNYAVTNEFGDHDIDPVLLEKYQKAGVAGHDGIDFALPEGTEVLSVDDGVVVLAEPNHDYGTTVVIQHSWGKSYYGHLSKIIKGKGEKVVRGEVIALSGNTGLSTGAHLHLGIKLNKHNTQNGYYGKTDPSDLINLYDVKSILGASTDYKADNTKQLSWEIDIKKGESKTFTYFYKAPTESPQFYTLGPSRIFSGNTYIYGETRPWQIAVDATETKWASSHITGGFSNPNNAIGATNGTWSGDVNSNSSYTSRWAMEDPSGAISGTQTIKVVARKGSNSGTPSIAINLYENGSLVQSIVGTTSVTSTTGQTVSGTFNASAITNPNNVEIEVVQTNVGGNPNTRNSAQIDSIEWAVNLLTTTTVSTTGTQVSQIARGTTNAYVGGAFTMSASEGTVNVSSITVSETGTVNASSFISNLDIYYETAATCTYNGTETLFGTDTTLTSETAVVTGSMSVGTSQVCVYVVFDVGVGATSGNTIEIQMTNPSTGVTVSTGSVSPSSAVAISGTTTIVGTSFTQNQYRWYQNTDAVQPTTALALENTSTTLSTVSSPLRLRMNVTLGGLNLSASSQQFKLQHATSTSGPWTDVGTGDWAFYNNTTPTDGATITSTLLSASDVAETYEEGNPTVSNPNAITVGQDGEWDFSLDPTNANEGTYYFRMVESDGSELGSYTRYPTLDVDLPTSFTQSGYQWYENPSGDGGWNVGSASYDDGSRSFSVANQLLSNPNPVFKSDGTKMYVMGGFEIYQYSLSTAWDVSTASYDSISFSAGTQDTNMQGLAFKSDGTKMYMVGGNTDTVYQYSLSTAWDISTASYDSISFSVGTQETNPTDFFFKFDGTKMYIVGSTGDAVYQYSLSTAWDISTASYDSISFSVGTQETNPTGISFKSDGTKMYVVGWSTDIIYQYSLSAAWDVSTTSYDSVSFSVASQEINPFGISFKSDGTKMYVAGSTGDTVYQYSLSTAWDVSTAKYNTFTLSIAGQEASSSDLAFKSDGTKVYVLGTTNDTVYQYSLSTAWDVSTASYDLVSFSVAGQEDSPQSLAFKSDGTKMYVLGDVGNTVDQYSLSTAWDVSTASYDLVSFSIGGQEGIPSALAFKSDGTKMYVLGQSNDTVYQYSLSTAWDVSTASYDLVSFSIGGQDGASSALVFKSDGTKMYVVGDSSNAVYQYSLVSWDLSTASYGNVSFSFSTQESGPRGLAFKSDGTKMYVVGYANDTIYQYSVSGFLTDVGTSLAALNTAADAPEQGTGFRLRMLLHVGSSPLSVSGESFKLQVAQKVGASCGGGDESFADVSDSTGGIRYNNLTGASDGDVLTVNASDPTHSTDDVVAQTYEELNNFTNSVAAIPVGDDGMWDFSLVDFSASSGTTYCFRAVKSDGSALDTYSVYAEITTAGTPAPSGPELSQLMRHGKWFNSADVIQPFTF